MLVKHHGAEFELFDGLMGALARCPHDNETPLSRRVG
jgi:hypothetical protein